ncbi:MAG: hypothetical protein WC378_04830 [Opitutaceae bacterium]|jgi:hypothetical protein
MFFDLYKTQHPISALLPKMPELGRIGTGLVHRFFDVGGDGLSPRLFDPVSHLAGFTPHRVNSDSTRILKAGESAGGEYYNSPFIYPESAREALFRGGAGERRAVYVAFRANY